MTTFELGFLAWCWLHDTAIAEHRDRHTDPPPADLRKHLPT